MNWAHVSAVVILWLLVAPPAAAWSVQDITIEPAGGTAAPGALMAASFTAWFDPFTDPSGRTFDASHTLEITTDLTGATWSATLVNIGKSRDPITTPLGAKSGPKYGIDGSTLSFNDAQLNLVVTIRGTAPDVRGQEMTVVSVHEVGVDGMQVPDVGETVTYLVAYPTNSGTPPHTSVQPATTAEKTPATVPETTRKIPRVESGTATTVRQTYSPGPDPVLVIGILAVAGIGGLRFRRGKIR